MERTPTCPCPPWRRDTSLRPCPTPTSTPAGTRRWWRSSSAPLGLVPYETASLIWFALELGLLPVLVVLVAAAQRLRCSALHVLVASGLLLLWHPFIIELQLGQLTMLLAALLMGSWVAYRRGRPRLAGVLLGLAVGVKLMPFVVLAYFLVKRKWTVASWALGTFAATSVAAAGVLGADAMGSYLTEGLREAAHWRTAFGKLRARRGGLVADRRRLRLPRGRAVHPPARRCAVAGQRAVGRVHRRPSWRWRAGW